MSPESTAPGWDQISAAMRRLHPDQQPRHVGYLPGTDGDGVLQGCSAYAGEGCWHYVTLGLSELFRKSPDTDPAISGWGFELTLRVARRPGEAEAPSWPFTFLEDAAAHTSSRGVLFLPGHRMDWGRAITGGDPPSHLTALAVADDPELGTIDTVNGRVAFRQLVGITAQELELMKTLSTAAVLEGMRRANPTLITDPARGQLR